MHISFVLKNDFWKFLTLIVVCGSLSIVCLRSKYSEPESLLDQYLEIRNDKGPAVHWDTPASSFCPVHCELLIQCHLIINYLVVLKACLY